MDLAPKPREGEGGVPEPEAHAPAAPGQAPPRDSDLKPLPNHIPATVAVPLWMRRLSLVVFVAFCIELGMLLVVLPWTRLWADNSLVAGHPTLRAFVQQNFVRGCVSGFGLIDIWLGISEAMHYKESGDKGPPKS